MRLKLSGSINWAKERLSVDTRHIGAPVPRPKNLGKGISGGFLYKMRRPKMRAITLRIFYLMDENGIQDQLERELTKVLAKYEYEPTFLPKSEVQRYEFKPGEMRDLVFNKPVDSMLYDPDKLKKTLYPEHEDIINKSQDPGGSEVEGGENGSEV
jgi:hypothetical protein